MPHQCAVIRIAEDTDRSTRQWLAAVRWMTWHLLATLAVAGLVNGLVAQEPSSGNNQNSADVDALGDPLPAGALMRFGTVRFQHPDTVAGIALSADQKTLVSIGRKGLLAWDATTGKVLWQKDPQLAHLNRGLVFSPTSYGVHPICFKANENRFYSSGPLGVLNIWDAASGEHESVKLVAADDITIDSRHPFKSIDVSPTGELIAVGNASQLLVCEADGKVLYAVTNNPKESIESAQDPGREMSDRMTFGGEFSYSRFSPIDSVLAVVNSELPKTIRILDSKTGNEIRQIAVTHRVVRMEFTPDGKHIVATERDCAVRKYSVESGEEVWSLVFPPMENAESYTSDVVVSPDGKLAAVGAPIGSENRIRVVDVDSGKEVGVLKGHAWKPWALAFTADSNRLYSSGWDSSIMQWNMQSFQPIPLPEGERTSGVVCFNQTDGSVVYSTMDDVIRIADPDDGKVIRSIEASGLGEHIIRISPDGKKLAASGTTEDEVQMIVWNIDTGEQLHHWHWPLGRDPHSSVTGMCFSPDGQTIAASVFRQNKGFVFDVDTGEQRYEFQHPQIHGVGFDTTGEILTSVGWDSKIRFWKAASGELHDDQTIEMSDGVGGTDDLRMFEIHWSPDGKRFVTLHLRNQIRVWDAQDRNLINEINKPGGIMTTIAFSNTGQWLAVGTRGGDARIVDIPSGEVLMEKPAHSDTVHFIEFGPDEKTFLTGGSDGVSYLWSLRPESTNSKLPGELYQDLVGADGAAAYRAHWALLDQPETTIKLLTQKFNAAPVTIDEEEIARWIADTGSDDYRTRINAQKDLSQLGFDAVNTIQRAMEGATSTEQKLRLQSILKSLNESVNSSELSRPLAVLHAINTDESQALLKSVSEKYPETWLAQQAKRLMRK